MNMPTTSSNSGRAGRAGSSLHSGKWTHEESEYVRELIQEFETGSLNIEEGLSLRRFLSKALNCSPKRISKKFEGSLYNGKQLYKRKTSALTPKEIEARRAKLRNLEHKYQESLRVLEMVEASRKPTQRISVTLPSKAPLLNPFGAVVGPVAAVEGEGSWSAALQRFTAHSHLGCATSGLCLGNSAGAASAFSREARIAQLKADIALASMALESSASSAAPSAAASAAAAAVLGRRDSLSAPRDTVTELLERSSQSEILAALSQHRMPIPGLPSASAAASRARGHAALDIAAAANHPLALNQWFVRGTTNTAIPSSQDPLSALPAVDLASLRSSHHQSAAAAAVAASQQQALEGLKRELAERGGDQQPPAFKRFKMV